MIMAEHAVMPYQHYKNACDAIRAKGAGSSSIKSGDMATAINSISGGTVSLPDISFTKINGCPPFAQKDGDYFGDDIRSYLTDRLGQPGDLLLTVVVYFVPVSYSLNIPYVATARYISNNGGVSILCAVSTPNTIPLLTSEPANDFTSSGELFFFRIRGCQLYRSFINTTMSIESKKDVIVKSDVTDNPRAASFGFAFSSTATDMLTCSTDVADNDVLKHSFDTMEFDVNDKHVRYAFFSTVRQRTTPGGDKMVLKITNPGSGAYGFMQTGFFYS